MVLRPPQASNGTYNHDANDPSRRGHSSHLSISDDSHHVTEAIGYMYDDSYDRRDSRRLSYVSSPLSEAISTPSATRDNAPASGSANQQPLPIRTSSMSNNRQNGKARESPTEQQQSSPDRESSGQLSPALSRAASTKKAANSMPLNDIDYDSDPATVAQELNNLAALRRMSMDVGAGDPDLPATGQNANMPSLAPSASAGEDDASRLFWVPAHVHPGIAPNEFKSFLQDKADQIQRKSGDFSSAESHGTPLQREDSGGGLQRKKSMLSRQVDSSGESDRGDDGQLDSVTEESSDKRARESTASNFAEEDMPILPPAPPGHSLRRSTRTTYRKGSFKSGERVGPSRRLPRTSESNTEHSRQTSTSSEDPPILGLTRVSTDPTDGIPNYSRSAARTRSKKEGTQLEDTPSSSKPSIPKETADSDNKDTPSVPSAPTSTDTPPQTQPYIPERTSSHESPPPTLPPPTPPPPEPSTSRSSKRAGFVSAPSKDSNKSLDDIVSQPSPLPGSNTRTDTLSLIPTAAEEKSEPKKSKNKKESESGGRKSSWHWRRATEDKDKDKKKDDDGKKGKSKILKSSSEKSHDNTRLDVLQTSIDGGAKGRESLTLERTESSKADEDDRRKDSGKKSSGGEGKKEKETSIFSSFFGGSKRKLTGDNQKKNARNPSPEPRLPILKPDVDYNWTRFSILEERAIYRMAHIKLANPRRALYSQVLLSNFMYSYLAKVQQMHPQMSMSTGQDQQEKDDDQPDEYAQYQRYQDVRGDFTI